MVLILRNIFLLFLFLICFKIGYSQTGLGINTVVIDPGHGGKDPGAVSPNNNYEKTVVLKVSLLLGEMIQKKFPEVKVIYTRNDDRFIGLAKRAKIAKARKRAVKINSSARLGTIESQINSTLARLSKINEATKKYQTDLKIIEEKSKTVSYSASEIISIKEKIFDQKYLSNSI